MNSLKGHAEEFGFVEQVAGNEVLVQNGAFFSLCFKLKRNVEEMVILV